MLFIALREATTKDPANGRLIDVTQTYLCDLLSALFVM